MQKKAIWLSDALQIAVKRRKGKIYPFECRVPKNSKERNKKVFLSDQCKEIEENNRVGKT